MCSDLKSEFTEEQKQKIRELRELIQSHPELDIGTEDVLLTKFLYCTDWDVKAAFKRVQNYYDFKANYPTWVSTRLPREFKDIMQLKSKYILPNTDKNGRTIYIHKIVDAFSKFPNYFMDLIEFDDLIFEGILSMPNTQKNGVSAIIDMKGLNRSFFKYLNPRILKIVNKKNDALPFRETHFHVVNTSLFMSTALSMIMPFLGKKIKDKIYFHGSNYDKLREHFGYENLPKEFGGPPENEIDFDHVYDFLFEKEDYFKQLQSYRKVTK